LFVAAPRSLDSLRNLTKTSGPVNTTDSEAFSDLRLASLAADPVGRYLPPVFHAIVNSK
jgi:hypothetical protein